MAPRPVLVGFPSLFAVCTWLAGCGASKTSTKIPSDPGALRPAAALEPTSTATTAPASAQVFGERETTFSFQDPDRLKKLQSAFTFVDTLAKEELARQKIPGLSVGIVIDGELAYTKGFGFADLEKKEKPDADTVFRIGSITKSVTALAVLSLRDDGALALDDPLSRWIPEATGLVYPTRDAPVITLRHLLTHTSGLPGQSNTHDAPSEAELTGSLREFALESAPGTRFSYSNLGFGLLGITAGRAAHAPFRDVISKRILLPLGMTSTGFDRATIPVNRLATGYMLNPAGEPHPVEDIRIGAGEGAGGLYSTVRDVARYLAAQLDAYPPRNAPEKGPLRRSTIREAHLTGFHRSLEVGLADDPKKGDSLVRAVSETYGFGWGSIKRCEFDDEVGHGGALPGYRASVVFLRDHGVGVVVLANALPADVGHITRRVLEALRKTGGLSARSAQPSSAFEPAMKKLLAVYNTWDEAGYRAMLRDGRHTVFDEKEELAGYKKLHGVCKGYSPIEIKSPLEVRFQMDCERGPFEMQVLLTNDGFIDGFVGISRDVPIAKDLRGVADRLTGLIRKWDDGVYKKHLAKAKPARDDVIASFEGLRAAHGSCSVKSSTIQADERKIRLECERGGDLALVLTVDKGDPSLVERYAFEGVSEGTCPVR